MNNLTRFYRLEDAGYRYQYKENRRADTRLQSYKVIGF